MSKLASAGSPWRALLRHLPAVILFLIVASCSGGGCGGGCSSCGGITPLSGDFPVAKRIENSASARITPSGFAFLDANLDTLASKLLGGTGGGISFQVPMSSTSLVGLTVTICPNGANTTSDPKICDAEIDLSHAALSIASATPHDLHITGTLPLRVQDLQVHIACADLNIAIDGDSSCPSNNTGAYDQMPVDVDISIETDTDMTHSRYGYTQVKVLNLLDQTAVTNNLNSNLQICGIPSCDAICCISNLCTCAVAGIASSLKSTVVSQLYSQLASTIQNTVDNQLCQKDMPNPCPAGTDDVSGICRYGTASNSPCVPILLGTSGHMNVGNLLASISPGVTAGLDYMLTAGGSDKNTSDATASTLAWGDLDPVAMGGTLSLYGGAEASPATSCVPVVPQTIPTGIPVPDQLYKNTLTGWPLASGPDLNIALAGRYINYTLGNVYNSGALCLGVSTDKFQALSTGYVSAVVPSLKDLTFEPGKSSKPAAMAITTRPQKVPTAVIGGGTDVNKDPLLKITLPSFAIDFYVWSLDRYIRAFTYTGDVTVPVNLQTGVNATTNPNDGIIPVLGNLSIANGKVTNSDLVWEDPNQLSSALSSLLGGIVGSFLGKGFSPINLNSSLASLGIALNLPPNAFQKLTKGTDDFIGLFGNLQQAMTMMVHTQVQILGTEIHPEAMHLVNANRDLFPKVHIALASPEDDGTRDVEYTYWIDDQPRAAWTRSRDVWVDSQYLFLQGKHTLSAAARVVNHPETEDRSPPSADFIIDVLPPVVTVTKSDTDVAVHAYDYVSEDDALQVRSQLISMDGTEGGWTAWQPYSSTFVVHGGASQSIEVQVRDEAGNVSDVNGLIRGRPDPTISSGSSACGCSTPGKPDAGRLGVLAAFGALVMLVGLARRRRTAGGALVIGSLALVASGTQGCSCGGSPGATAADDGGDGGNNCGPGCLQPCGTPNALGLIGEYTSYAVASDGTIWVAGYNDADVTSGLLYGDLVAGKYDKSKQKVQWVDVDGLPAEPGDGDCAPNASNTWRHGLTDPGPDVGLWTSIQLDSSGNPMISYYDATNQALKFASSSDGGNTWSSHTVMKAVSSDVGRYSKMIVSGGKPVIGFLVIEPGMGGWTQSRVVLATGTKSTPASSSDWAMANALVDPQTPCVAEFCPSGDVCVKATGQCQAPVKGCTPSDCGASEAGIGSTPQSCVTVDGGTSCQATLTTTYIGTYPDAVGDYVTMAPNGSKGVGIVVYDRTRGNLVGVVQQSGTWTSAILDGQTGANNDPNRKDTGDVGVGASLTIDTNGDWHISYVNGWTEALQYLTVPAGNIMKPLAPEVVDDGLHLNGMLNADGQHIVGDDSSVTVDSGGTIRIVYQDATVGTLHEASGAPTSGNKHNWTVKALTQTGEFAGFFPHYVTQDQMIGNWYRKTDHSMKPPMVTGDVALVSP